VEVKLYSMSISHPSRAAGLMVQKKGIKPQIVNLAPGSQQVLMRLYGFRHGTVPGMKADGRRVQGSIEISRALDDLIPDPPLFPSDPERRAAVEDAERWGNEVYQPVPRRIFRWAVSTDGELRRQIAELAGVPAPALGAHLFWPVTKVYARFEGGGEAAARADVAALPDHLDHIDGLIAAGTLNGEDLNAADFQIGTTTRVLFNFPQLRPLLEGRPASEHAMRVIADYGTELPVHFPAEWVPAATPA
jgi:glutathione S-transferase